MVLSCTLVAGAQEIKSQWAGAHVAFLGDSITQAGADANGYITLFEKAITNLGIEHYTMYKKGRGGDTSKQMLERVDADVIAWKPTWTTFSCGVNDICYAARRQTLEQYQANVTAIFDKLDAIKTKVVVLTTTLLYETVENATLESYVGWLRAEAKRRGYLIAEVNEAMKAEAKALGATGRAPWKLTVDGIHMNDIGNRVMAWELLKAFGVPESRKDEVFKIFTSGKLIPATPKAVWCEGTKSLTFYYDTRSYDQAEGVTKVFPINAQGDQSWGEVLPSVEQVTFDLSFVYFQPANCCAWFWNEELAFYIDYLKNPRRFLAEGGQPPRLSQYRQLPQYGADVRRLHLDHDARLQLHRHLEGAEHVADAAVHEDQGTRSLAFRHFERTELLADVPRGR